MWPRYIYIYILFIKPKHIFIIYCSQCDRKRRTKNNQWIKELCKICLRSCKLRVPQPNSKKLWSLLLIYSFLCFLNLFLFICCIATEKPLGSCWHSHSSQKKPRAETLQAHLANLFNRVGLKHICLCAHFLYCRWIMNKLHFTNNFIRFLVFGNDSLVSRYLVKQG